MKTIDDLGEVMNQTRDQYLRAGPLEQGKLLFTVILELNDAIDILEARVARLEADAGPIGIGTLDAVREEPVAVEEVAIVTTGLVQAVTEPVAVEEEEEFVEADDDHETVPDDKEETQEEE